MDRERSRSRPRPHGIMPGMRTCGSRARGESGPRRCCARRCSRSSCRRGTGRWRARGRDGTGSRPRALAGAAGGQSRPASSSQGGRWPGGCRQSPCRAGCLCYPTASRGPGPSAGLRCDAAEARAAGRRRVLGEWPWQRPGWGWRGGGGEAASSGGTHIRGCSGSTSRATWRCRRAVVCRQGAATRGQLKRAWQAQCGERDEGSRVGGAAATGGRGRTDAMF